MKLNQQLSLSLFRAPLTLFQQDKRSWLALASYLTVGLAIFALFGYLLLQNQASIKQLLLDYLFPQSWHSISEQLLAFFFESQSKQVLGNLILSGSLVVASIFLFPVKELYSASFEKSKNYPNGRTHEFPLWMQAIEETRLFLFYLTAQLTILWIGYYPYEWANITSITLSYLFLFYTFGLDIISPTFQRHRIKYSKINKLLSKNAVATLLFGLIYSLPALLLSQWILTLESLNLLEVCIILFSINLLFIGLSIPAGTEIASRLLPENATTKPVTRASKRVGYSVACLLLITGLVLHIRLVQSMHHKTQVLKANYSINWDSFQFDYRSVGDLLSGDSFGNFSFELTIENPTEFDLVFENSQLYINKNELPVSQVAIAGFSVPAQSEKEVAMKFDAKSNFSQLTLGNLSEILEHWTIELHIELFPGIPFIIEVMGKDKQEEV